MTDAFRVFENLQSVDLGRLATLMEVIWVGGRGAFLNPVKTLTIHPCVLTLQLLEMPVKPG